MPAAKKRTAAKPMPSTAGQRILAAMRELNTPEAAAAAIAGRAPAGASYTVTRVKVSASAFTAPALTPADVAATRADLGLTQPAFAAFLGVAVETVRAWEQGRNPLSGIALRFLAEVRGDLAYWKRKVSAAAG